MSKNKPALVCDRAGLLSAYFWVVRSEKDIINAYTIKVRQQEQSFGRRNSLSGFKFGEKSLFNSSVHLQCDLGVALIYSQLFQPVFHTITQ